MIEQYLAKQFDLMGNNEYEENLIKSFHSSSASLHSLHATTVAFIPEWEARKQAMEAFRDGPFTQWVTIHDKHLKDNGSNGHYIGDKVKKKVAEEKKIEHRRVYFCLLTIDFSHSTVDAGGYQDIKPD